MGGQAMSEASLFDLIIHSPEADRSAILDRETAGQPELRERIEKLVAAHDRRLQGNETRSLGNPHLTQTNSDEPESLTRRNDDQLAGTVIAGKYKLLERIGEGGMGDVWLAQQTEPVKRQVAVKLIKAGMDSKQVLARFEAERQALAMMDHPNIAKVLDGGLHENRPYFVMELVKGVPITEYCDHHKLTPKQRLELFVPVCQAIQHAHQKGVIHRDIKPSNVLIAMYDDRPVPKVIDFGVAKATGMDLTNLTLVTGYGSIIGTPEYMSPEQASFNQLDVDTRSDVYALGVLLYELLTGTTPLDRKNLGQAALLEVLRIVREVDAPRPSVKLSTLVELPSLAACRSVEPKKLAGLIRGELDWIVLKALEKDRSRRYDTANSFARDIQRHLANEIVEAQPPSRGYRLRKWAARNTVLITFIAIILPIYFICMGFATLHWLMARDSEQRAKEEKVKTEQALQLELEARRTATRERDRAVRAEREAIAESNRNAKWAEISGDIMRAFTDHRDPLLREVHIGQTLDDIAKQLKGKIGGHPDLESQVRVRLGTAYEAIRDFSAAKEQYLRVLEIDRERKHPEQIFVLKAVARLYTQEFDYETAEPFLVRVEATMRSHLNEEPKMFHVPFYAAAAYDLGEVLKNRNSSRRRRSFAGVSTRGIDSWPNNKNGSINPNARPRRKEPRPSLRPPRTI
jgi:serine/threonine protein kinase